MKGLYLTLVALSSCSVSVLLQAEDSHAGTAILTDTSGPITYSAGAYTVANPTPIPLLDSGPECSNPQQPCHDFPLKVSLPQGYAAAHPGASIRIQLSWAGDGNSDYDLYVYPGDITTTYGSEAALSESATSSDPEMTALPAADGNHRFTVKVVPYAPGDEDLQVTIELVPGPAGDAAAVAALPSAPDLGTPAAPQLEGRRGVDETRLSWIPLQEGDIRAYRILRGTAPGKERQYSTVTGRKTAFTDRRLGASVLQYYYKVIAVNDAGSGAASNEVVLSASELTASRGYGGSRPVLAASNSSPEILSGPGLK